MIAGGSGLYLPALLEGITPIPPTDSAVRERLRAELDRHGLGSLRARLIRSDPITASRLEEGDTQRILRALEVVESTGRPLAEWLAESPMGRGPVEAIRIGLTLPRGLLYDRISERVKAMIQAGWVTEVQDLLHRGLGPELPAFRAIGYREIVAHLRDEIPLESAIEATVQATRRFAKRQMTWFRSDETIHWYSTEDPRQCLEKIKDLLSA